MANPSARPVGAWPGPLPFGAARVAVWLDGSIASGAIARALSGAGVAWIGLVDARRPERARRAALALAQALGVATRPVEPHGPVTSLAGWSHAGQAALEAGATWLVLPAARDAAPGAPLPLRLHAAETALVAHGLAGLWAPLLGWEPVAIARLALGVGLPFALSWDCETDPACGRCPGCLGRARAFRQLGMPDPTASHEEEPPCPRP